MESARKAQIGAAFTAAAQRYDEGAHVQRLVASRLAARAGGEQIAPDSDILEIGCGTGLLTREIRKTWPDARLTATDIAPEMIAATAGHDLDARLMVMDGEAPNLGDERFDLILSSLTFQWFDDLPRALTRLHALLKPSGMLCFATMGAQSFANWRTAHEQAGQSAGLRIYPTRDQLDAMLKPFSHASVSEECIALPERSGKALIRHFRAIGAHVPRSGYRPLAPVALRRVINLFDEAGGTSSYHILYGSIRHD